MAATLTFQINGKPQDLECKSILTIGRDRNSDIVLDDLMVSRNHAMIRRIGRDDYYLIDSGSANGSLINTRRVSMPVLLKNADVIQVGESQFIFHQEHHAEGGVDTLSMQETVISDTPDIKQITIMVADIRGFTSLSEQVHIRTLTKMMNSWFNQVSDVIFRNGGTVDKFIGDCVFARWEAGEQQDNIIYKVIQAASDINDITCNLNKSFPEVTDRIRIGVGINTGAASVGIGQDNTALGDAVNLAFRLESATKIIGKDIVMSESSYKVLDKNHWKDAEQHIRVKGKRDPVRIIGLDFSETKLLLNSA